MPKPSEYWRVPGVDTTGMEMYGTWVLVEEDLAERTQNGLVRLEKPATTIGVVARVGSSSKENLREGDEVLYEAFQGGRWSFGDRHYLIMDESNILCVIGREDD